MSVNWWINKIKLELTLNSTLLSTTPITLLTTKVYWIKHSIRLST